MHKKAGFMDLTWFKTKERRFFEAGLALRVVLLVAVAPAAYQDWFVPFLTWLGQGGIDPWSSYIRAGGGDDAFPYGVLYVLIFAPLTLFGDLLGGDRGAMAGLGVSVLLLDAALYTVLRAFLEKEIRFRMTYVYWLSPITLYCCYWHGQLDVLPILLLIAGLYALRRYWFYAAGALCALAASAKFSMAAALPIIAIYFYGNRRYHPYWRLMAKGFAAVLFLTLPFLASSGFRDMAITTPEALKIFSFRFVYTEQFSIYLAPMALVLVTYLAWRIRRFDERGLLTLVGYVFFILFLFTPASPGWAMWIVPFLCLQMARSDASMALMGALFSSGVTAFYLLTAKGAMLFNVLDLRAPIIGEGGGQEHFASLILTVTVLAGGVFALQMYRRNLTDSKFHQASRNPLLVAIAGDSGAGKDTFSQALEGLIGPNAAATVSGDDYHNWDRKKPMWRALTHLNPAANDLAKFEIDILALCEHRSVRARHYDHATGRMTKPRLIQSRDTILVSGLHGLYLDGIRKKSALNVFLDMDEGLRRQLKIQRDVEERGHPLEAVERSIEARMSDAERFIHPQKEHADLILQLALEPRRGQKRSLNLSSDCLLRAEFAPSIEVGQLTRALVTLGDLSVQEKQDSNGRTHLEVSGFLGKGAAAMIAERVTPRVLTLFAIRPQWTDGPTGVMQLCAAVCLEQKLFRGQDIV